MQKTHNIPPKENEREVFQWGSGGWESEACTAPGVLLLWGLCSMSRLICMIFVADLIACRLNFFMSAMACRPVANPKAVEWVPCVAAVNGACCS